MVLIKRGDDERLGRWFYCGSVQGDGVSLGKDFGVKRGELDRGVMVVKEMRWRRWWQ